MARGDLRRTRDQRLVLVGKSSRMKNVVGMREMRKMEVPAEPKAMTSQSSMDKSCDKLGCSRAAFHNTLKTYTTRKQLVSYGRFRRKFVGISHF
ncbi:hypothetical protein DY000_02053748 [Brassica cretica]|uniref:Uncharacterized protein n=1 Tax=Brassica cretica TaxID=69181 RepID=A0ABQ7AJD4_BRACR|nr:hypothetical protein DY000_02053748 [Brassica cretica]